MRISGHARARAERGFTLSELTVVVAIIGVLIANFYPLYVPARTKAHYAACLSNLYQVGLALQLYAHDHDGRLPIAHNDFRPLMGGYVKDTTILVCPVDTAGTGIAGANRRAAPADPLAPWPGTAPLYSSYQYRGGLSVEDRADIPIAADWELRHSSATAGVLSLSGSVRSSTLQSWVPVAPGPRPLPPGVRPAPGAVTSPPLQAAMARGSAPAPTRGPGRSIRKEGRR